MICKNCGNEVADNAAFCGICGAKIVAETEVLQSTEPVSEFADVPASDPFVAETPVDTDTNFFENQDSEVISKPKKHKKLTKILLFAGIPAIAIVLVVVLLFDSIQGFWKKNFSSDSEYLAFVEAKALGGYTEVISKTYGNVLQSVNGVGAKGEIAIELGDSLSAMLPAFTSSSGMDLSWLKNIKILMDADSDAEKGSGRLTLVLSDQEIASIDFYFDSTAQTFYFRCEELFDKYISINLNDVLNMYESIYDKAYDDLYGDVLDDPYGLYDDLDDLDGLYDDLEDLEDLYDMYGMSTSGVESVVPLMSSDSLGSMFSVSDFMEYLPSEAELKNILDNYIDVVLDQVTDNDVTRTTTTVTANGVTEECTALEIKVTEDLLTRVAKTVLEKARDDSDIISIIERIIKGMGAAGAMFGDTVISEYQKGIDSLLETLAEQSGSSNEELISLTSYVNDSHEIIGREISTVFGGSKREVLSYVSAENGGDYGFEFNVEELSFVGKGTKSGDAITADFALNVSGQEYVKIGLENFEANLASEEISGAVTLKLGSSVMGLLDNEATAAVSMYNPAIRLDLDLDSDSVSYAVSLLTGDAELIKLSISGENTEANIAEQPSASDTVGIDDIDPSDFSLDTIMNNLKKAGFPTELLSFAQYSMLS